MLQMPHILQVHKYVTAPYQPVLLCMQAVNTQVPHHVGLWLYAFVFDGVDV